MAALTSTTISAFIQHEGTTSSGLQNPDKALVQNKATAPTSIELDSIQWGLPLTGPSELGPAGPSIPPTPGELERSQPPTPKRDDAVDALAASSPATPRNRWRLAAAGVVFMFVGMTDAVTGAVIPSIEAEYHVTYSVVSLLFITYALGFITAAPLLSAIDAKLGRSRMLMTAALFLSVGYITITCAPPFPVIVVAFWFTGTGMAMFLATTNAWIANLLNGTFVLGIMHGLYGVGGIVSPLIATSMISRGMRWSLFYTIPLALSVVSIGFLGWSFRGFEADASVQLLTALERTASRTLTAQGEMTRRQVVWQSAKNRTTLLGALFIFFYQGGEVAISGWVISYLIQQRAGDPAQVGNVTSGFWGGITVGRFLLTGLCHKIGEKKAVPGLIFGAAVFQALVWAVPDIITNAVAESIVGLFLGPVYPCAVAVFSMIWPRKIQTSSLSLVTSMGSSGGALVPFVTGAMAQATSTVVLHPIVLFAFGVMVAAWLGLPKIQKRTEQEKGGCSQRPAIRDLQNFNMPRADQVPGSSHLGIVSLFTCQPLSMLDNPSDLRAFVSTVNDQSPDVLTKGSPKRASRRNLYNNWDLAAAMCGLFGGDGDKSSGGLRRKAWSWAKQSLAGSSEDEKPATSPPAKPGTAESASDQAEGHGLVVSRSAGKNHDLCFQAHPTSHSPRSPSTALSVAGADFLGTVRSATTHVNRDLGFQGQIGQYILLTYGDTMYSDGNYSDHWRGMTSDSVALATKDPLVVVDPDLNDDGYPKQFCPIIEHFGEDKSECALGITNVVETEPGQGILYFLLNHRPGGINNLKGAGVATVTLSDSYPPVPAVKRLGQYWWDGDTEPWYGDVSAIRANDYIYSYGHAKDNPWVYLARVPWQQATSLDAYEYWNGETFQKERLKTKDLGEKESVFWQINQGQVVWSAYLEAYLFVYCDNFWNSKVQARRAPAPEGPWSQAFELYQAHPITEGSTCYAAVPHPYYDPSGKSLVVTYTNHPNTIQAVRVTFE